MFVFERWQAVYVLVPHWNQNPYTFAVLCEDVAGLANFGMGSG